MQFFRISIVSILILIVLAACAVNKKEPDNKKTDNTTSPSSGVTNVGSTGYKIGVDDMVQVSVWRNTELSVTVPVRPDGMISVPLVGDVQAGGLSPGEVAEKIEKKLSFYIRDPRVAVIVTELRSHEFLNRIRVTGAVRTPSTMPFRQGMTVLDAVLVAGGVNDFAAPNRTKLYRKGQFRTEVIEIKLGKILRKGLIESNIELKPGDIITVPERLF